MKKLLLIVIFYSITSQAQSTNSSKTYQITDTTYTLISIANKQKLLISIIGNYRNNELTYYDYRVEVFNHIDKLLQTFSSYYIYDVYSDKDDFRLQDINFDNKDDLCVKTFEDQFNASYEFWQYDTTTYSFSYDSLLSDVIAINPYFDEGTKTITTGAGFPDWTYWEKTYIYNNSKLKLITEDYQEKLRPSPDNEYQFIYKRVKKVRQGNEMVIEKEVTGIIEEIGMGWDDR